MESLIKRDLVTIAQIKRVLEKGSIEFMVSVQLKLFEGSALSSNFHRCERIFNLSVLTDLPKHKLQERFKSSEAALN